ncbi:MAG TPA: hypothetical protein VLV81_01180 [Acidimicrobiia bacterium]|nr:hypothetical protein [Acidimicrobiia bacterium]
MSRVRDEDLDRLEPLLAQLRAIGPLHERRRGTFTRGSAAFLHFHGFTSGPAADLKADGCWLRYDVQRPAGRRILLRDVRRVLRDETGELTGQPTGA